MNISAKFQLHPPYNFWGDDFWFFFFANLYFWLPWQPIKFRGLTKFICLVEDYSRNISVKLLSKYLQWDSNIGPLSHLPLQVNGNFSCHSNESTWARAIENIIFIAANVLNISAKFQVHPPYGFWGVDFWIFVLQIYTFSCHGNQSNSAVWTKFIRFIEDYSRNISVKLLSKYLQWVSNRYQFPLFPF